MESSSNNNNKVCELCSVGEGKYVCPRCNLLYCSVNCYRSDKHAACSEIFYKECIMNELGNLEPNNDSQKKIIEILKRMNPACETEFAFSDEPPEQEILDSDDDGYNYDEDECNEDNSDDLINRLAGIDLDCADEVWEKLNNEERLEFEKLLQSGDVTTVLPEFEPWWNYRNSNKVVDLQEESYFEKEHKRKCPKIIENIIPFSRICKCSPSPLILYNLINALTAYTFTVRYYNGDHHEFYNESVVSLVMLSKNLFSNQNFTDFDSSVNSVFLEITNCNLLNSSCSSPDEIKNDIIKIMNGPDINNLTFYVLAALCDIHELFSKFMKAFNNKKITSVVSSDSKPCSTSGKSSEFSKRFPDHRIHSSNLISNVSNTKSTIKNVIKKIEFYQSWLLEHYKSPLPL